MDTNRDMDTDGDRDRDGDMEGDMNRDGERDEDRDTNGDGDTFPQGIWPWGPTFEFEYLNEFETEFKNNLGYESGVYMGLIHE
jgi:hypothetical protein